MAASKSTSRSYKAGNKKGDAVLICELTCVLDKYDNWSSPTSIADRHHSSSTSDLRGDSNHQQAYNHAYCRLLLMPHASYQSLICLIWAHGNADNHWPQMGLNVAWCSTDWHRCWWKAWLAATAARTGTLKQKLQIR